MRLLSLITFLLISIFYTQKVSSQKYSEVSTIENSNWLGYDGLGRKLLTYEDVGSCRNEKYIGIFYYLWHGYHTKEIFDISEIINRSTENSEWGPRHVFHFWGKPEAGYYKARDPWVIRRNLQMLSNAGVDFLFFDVTNAFTYLETVKALCDISLQMRNDGISTPYICFCTYSNSGKVINSLYDEFYSIDEYKTLWFIWDYKPLIFGDKDDTNLRAEARNFFTFRYSWAWTDAKNNPDHWQWIDSYPQDFGWHGSKDQIEQVPVAVASHPTLNIGASYSNYLQPALDTNQLTAFTGQGKHFKEQWEWALNTDPKVIMVTQWNEWVAQRFICGQDACSNFLGKPISTGQTYFVDAYNEEFNRDIEPMDGGHTDNRYYQLVNYVRRYKGMKTPTFQNKYTNIHIDGEFSDWVNVGNTYNDPKGDTFYRNYKRYDDTEFYVNETGRNDIIYSKAVYNNDTVYFMVETSKALTDRKGSSNWMLLFIDTDNNPNTGWQRYDCLINKDYLSESSSSISSWDSIKESWLNDGEVSLKYFSNKLELSIPVNRFKMESNTLTFNFHWADNIELNNQINQFFINGESAPDRRFYYRFTCNTALLNAQKQLKLSDSVTVYPNPTQGKITLSSNSKHELIEFWIFDMLGNCILHKEDFIGNLSLDLQNQTDKKLKAGLYIIKIKDNQGLEYQQKLIVSSI